MYVLTVNEVVANDGEAIPVGRKALIPVTDERFTSGLGAAEGVFALAHITDKLRNALWDDALDAQEKGAGAKPMLVRVNKLEEETLALFTRAGEGGQA